MKRLYKASLRNFAIAIKTRIENEVSQGCAAYSANPKYHGSNLNAHLRDHPTTSRCFVLSRQVYNTAPVLWCRTE